jgi:TusA-related sulfurtransferase
MQVRKAGRPRKEFAKKAGDLNSGEVYFTFIADEQTVKNIKKIAKAEGISIKYLMAKALKKYRPNKDSLNHEQKLRAYIKNNSKNE